MELTEALRTTGAVREFTDEPVSDDALGHVLGNARFSPSGGNQQGWRVVVIEDPEIRTRLRDLYLSGWYDYLAMTAAGIRPWAPLNDRDAEAAALASGAAQMRADAEAGPGGFAEHLDGVPVLLAVLVDLRVLAAVDRDHARYTFAGGASVYPFAWSVLLAAHEEGLGGVMTTMAIRQEPAVLELVHAPPGHTLAAVLALGHPRRQPRRLTRRPVEAFTSVDHVDGRPFGAAAADGRPDR